MNLYSHDTVSDEDFQLWYLSSFSTFTRAKKSEPPRTTSGSDIEVETEFVHVHIT